MHSPLPSSYFYAMAYLFFAAALDGGWLLGQWSCYEVGSPDRKLPANESSCARTAVGPVAARKTMAPSTSPSAIDFCIVLPDFRVAACSCADYVPLLIMRSPPLFLVPDRIVACWLVYICTGESVQNRVTIIRWRNCSWTGPNNILYDSTHTGMERNCR